VSGPLRVEVALGDRSYPIVVGAGLVDRLAHEVPLPLHARRALVVTQPPLVALGIADRVERSLSEAGLAVTRVVVEDGEPAKRADTLVALWDAAAAVPLTRDDLVVAVGGGVVGDLAGLVAATYLRGVAVLQVPTTLLAQVDAAIGGKTAIDLAAGKNLVGAFHQPLAVACDTDVLASLPARVRTEGLAEIVKCGLALDRLLLDRLEHDPAAIAMLRGDALDAMVLRAAAAKAAVVAADEHEQGVRAHLNLGHTVGHALEAATGYAVLLHGEAVAIGTVAALRLGQRMGRTPEALVERAERLLAALGLPVRAPAVDRAAVWDALRRDKKVRDGVRFVLLEDVERPVVVPVPEDLVDAVLDELTVGAP
jgi:3-dehydroquinate synthase